MRRDSDEVAIWAWRGFLYGLAIALGLFIYMMSATANAQSDYPRDISYCWTNPSSYVDDTPIADGELTLLRIEVYRNNDTVPTFTQEIPATQPGAEQCETLVGAITQPGTYVGLGFAQANGLWSDASDPANPKKYTGKPRPPVFTRTFE